MLSISQCVQIVRGVLNPQKVVSEPRRWIRGWARNRGGDVESTMMIAKASRWRRRRRKISDLFQVIGWWSRSTSIKVEPWKVYGCSDLVGARGMSTTSMAGEEHEQQQSCTLAERWSKAGNEATFCSFFEEFCGWDPVCRLAYGAPKREWFFTWWLPTWKRVDPGVQIPCSAKSITPNEWLKRWQGFMWCDQWSKLIGAWIDESKANSGDPGVKTNVFSVYQTQWWILRIEEIPISKTGFVRIGKESMEIMKTM